MTKFSVLAFEADDQRVETARVKDGAGNKLHVGVRLSPDDKPLFPGLKIQMQIFCALHARVFSYNFEYEANPKLTLQGATEVEIPASLQANMYYQGDISTAWTYYQQQVFAMYDFVVEKSAQLIFEFDTWLWDTLENPKLHVYWIIYENKIYPNPGRISHQTRRLRYLVEGLDIVSEFDGTELPCLFRH